MDMRVGCGSGDRDPDGDADDVLTGALATQPLSRDSVQRVRAVVEREWVSARRRRRWAEPRWAALAAAAALAGIGIALVTILELRAPAASLGAVVRLEGEGLLVTSRSGQRWLKGGDALMAGDRVSVRAPVLVGLQRGGTLRLAAGSELVVTGTSQLALNRGLIYLDIPPGSSRDPLRISTPAGVVEHLGTEFEVLTQDSSVRVRVREGRIRFVGQGDTLTADAGTELLLRGDALVSRRSIDTFGRDWSWTAALAPDYEIEGRPLMGFLRWVSRELGRPLDFADPKARLIADKTILHGTVAHQAPLDAMSNVLATTSLSFELRGDKIWVRSTAAL